MMLRLWEPFAELRRMDAEMDRMWGHTFRPFRLWHRHGRLDGYVAIDVYHEDDNLVIKAALPGVDPEDTEVTFTEVTLTIKGDRRYEKEVKEEDYLHRERRVGTFRREVALPDNLDTEKAEATYENGILTVTIPRIAETKPKALKINVKSLEGKQA